MPKNLEEQIYELKKEISDLRNIISSFELRRRELDSAEEVSGIGKRIVINGNTYYIDSDGNAHLGNIHAGLKSGANQGAAGAAAGELWHDSDDDIVKMGV